MSINGVLEDLALADVLQFVHLGRRTGTLYMWQDDSRRAEIGFHDGKIVSAWTPGHRKLGTLLIDSEILRPETLEEALEQQESDATDQTLGQILIDRELVSREEIYRVIREQIEATIFELVTWQNGSFHFEVDELNPVDEIGLAPGELLQDLDLNTQMLLLEATRIFDERHREGSLENRQTDSTSLDQKLERAGFGRRHRPGAERGRGPASSGQWRQETGPGLESIRCQVVSHDPALVDRLSEELPGALVRVVGVRLREAGNRMPGASASPIVVLDLRSGSLAPEDIATLARTRPSASVVAMVGSQDDEPIAHRAGAIAVVVDHEEALVDCCRNLVRVFSHPQPQGTFGYAARGGFSRFRRVVFDVQSGLLSATMALNLMHVISESVERAVLFLVQGEELRAVGAFGFSNDDEPLAERTSGLRVVPSKRSALRRAMNEAKPLSLSFEDAELPSGLEAILGPPANGQVVVFPVMGAEQPVSVIYTDNGSLDLEIQDIKILELATSQVGVAFENELLSQQAAGGVAFGEEAEPGLQ